MRIVNICIMSAHMIGLLLDPKQTESVSEAGTTDALWVKRSAGVMNFTVSVSDKNCGFALDLWLY